MFDDELDLFVAADHPLASIGRLPLADLSGEMFVLREVGSATRDLALGCLAAQGCLPGETIELGSNEAVQRALS